VHALTETLNHERGTSSVPWAALNSNLREVPSLKRVSTQ
jgi:hypothetical protein